MRNFFTFFSLLFLAQITLAQKNTETDFTSETGYVVASEFHVTRPLREIFADQTELEITKKKGESEAVHVIDYDTTAETVEAIYFFILDLMNDFGLNVEKLVDNFTSTPGSQHFSEMGMKATRMQEEASIP